MQFIAQHYQPARLDEVLLLLERAEQPKRDLVIVTFDDGYLDNYQVAWPIARACGIPLHLFVTSSLIADDEPTFVMALMLAVDATSLSSVRLDEFGLGEVRLDDSAARDAAVRRIDAYAKPLEHERRKEVLAVLYRKLDVDTSVQRGQMLSWEQLREMSAGGVCIGAHSRTHPVLAHLHGTALADEIGGAKQEIEARLGTPVRYFAYPYGGRAEVSEEAEGVVRRAGFAAAVVLYEVPETQWRKHRIGRLMLTHDRTAAPWGGFSRALFACEVEGVAGRLFRRGRNLAATAAVAQGG
jgi:peptidoglycan/xylan/chitin deacetylase (PgdA/CDA1 family)